MKTLKVRVRDKHVPFLRKMAYEVNQIFNFINEKTNEKSFEPIPFLGIKFLGIPSAYDVSILTNGLVKKNNYLITSATVQEIVAYHNKACKQFKKTKLRWRRSGGSNRSLGFVPFRVGQCSFVNGQVKFGKHYFKIWDSYGLSQYNFKSGSFTKDSRGRWYFNVVIDTTKTINITTDKSVGIDLGLKTIATTSDGEKLEAKRFYQKLEKKLAIAQRAKNKKLVKTIHAKIKNKRNDTLHKFTTNLVNNYGAIFVGDVDSNKLVKTKFAKSVLDSGWGILKAQLKYKAQMHSVVYEEVSEHNTTQVCSHCGQKPNSSPKGMDGLGVREWSCICGAVHDRDINAAKNILAEGQLRLAVGISN